MQRVAISTEEGVDIIIKYIYHFTLAFVMLQPVY